MAQGLRARLDLIDAPEVFRFDLVLCEMAKPDANTLKISDHMIEFGFAHDDSGNILYLSSVPGFLSGTIGIARAVP
ncbi:hypothetical protein [Parendozoicomonas haliclonae]|uniref:hypothetical protein n=1 Tax=Parendozoicomonas haliclonae TaxID=1960125 RepID=UPI000B36498D|nr:hypothetical protein [Parendozoicomonas haliclonae]